MAQVGPVTRVGGSADDKGSGPKGTHDNTAKVAKRRAHERAEGRLQANDYADTDFLLPNRYVEVDPDEMEHIGVLLAGVQDFKVLRGSIAVLSLATSIEFAHLLTDASLIGRGPHALVVDLWQVKRSLVFDEEDDYEDDDDG